MSLLRLAYKKISGTSLVVQWLRLHAPNPGVSYLTPGQGARSCILQLRLGTAKINKIKNKFFEIPFHLGRLSIHLFIYLPFYLSLFMYHFLWKKSHHGQPNRKANVVWK